MENEVSFLAGRSNRLPPFRPGRSGRALALAMGTLASSSLPTLALAGCAGLRHPLGASPGAPLALVGQVSFGGERRVQATMNDVQGSATVSLIDTTTDTTVATGLTDSSGYFHLDLSSWSPTAGEVYYLEAIKGLDNNVAGHDAARVRTLLEQVSGNWESVEVGFITIDPSTTALSIIESLRGPSVVAPASLIGSMPTPTYFAGAANVSQSDFTTVLAYVNAALTANTDPVDAVVYSNGSYESTVGAPVPTPLPPPPTIFTLYPQQAAIGSEITIYGRGLAGIPASESISVAGATASIASTCPGLVVTTVPKVSPGPAQVLVSVGGSSAATLSLTVLATQSSDVGGVVAP